LLNSTIKAIEQGAIPLIHPSNYQFRDFKTNRANSIKPERTFNHSVQNEKNTVKIMDSYIEPKKTFLLRPLELSKNIQPQMQFNVHTENQRINEEIENSPRIMHEKFHENTNKNIITRDFKPIVKAKSKVFLGKNDIKKKTIMENRIKIQDNKRKFNNYSQEPYVEFDPTIINRQDDKSKNISDKPFLAVVPKDPWKNRIMETPSIRAYKNALVFFIFLFKISEVKIYYDNAKN